MEITYTHYFLIGAVTCLLLLLIALRINYSVNIKRAQVYLAKFNLLNELNVFSEAVPLAYSPVKLEHAVLLLHGYSTSPADFAELSAALRREKITYYAPLITGFGLADPHLLRLIKPSDWLRDAIFAYDLLAKLANKVSVIGQSNGAVLGAYIAQHRPVEHLILLGPNIVVGKRQRMIKKIMGYPFFRETLRILLPLFEKPSRPGHDTNFDTLDPNAARTVFHHPVLPTQSVIALWQTQDMIDITNMKYKDLTIIYGEHDFTVDIPALMNLLKKYSIPYQAFPMPNTAHNTLQDYDKGKVIEVIMKVL